MRYTIALVLAFVLCGCGPLDAWNAPKVGYIDPNTGCARWAHNVRGPDAYDIAHGLPYHCETPPHDPDFVDIDQVDQ